MSGTTDFTMVHIRITTDRREMLKQFSEKHDVSMTAVVSLAVDQFVEAFDKNVLKMLRNEAGK